MSPYLRKVKTASRATAVQIVEKRNGRRRILEHIGSAHDDTEWAVLISAAQQRLHGHQDELPIETLRRDPAAPVVDRTASQLLWTVLTRTFAQLGRLHGHQDELPIETLRRDPAAPVVDRTASQLLWTVLTSGFHLAVS